MRPDVVLDLKQALAAAARDPALRARAVAALRSAELWAAVWPNVPKQLRNLTSSGGVTAIPLFSDERELHDASQRYGWLGPAGEVPKRLVHISEATRAARQVGAQLIVIDVTSEHALEIDEGEMELLSAAPSSRPPAANELQRLRSTPPPADLAEVKRASGRPLDDASGHYSALKPRSVIPGAGTHGPSATFGATPTATMLNLAAAPEDDLLDELSALLREYPEVEWACLVTGARADSQEQPSVALRIEPAFRKNIEAITQKIRETSGAHGQVHDVLMLDTPEQMKQARSVGTPFYPWRKK